MARKSQTSHCNQSRRDFCRGLSLAGGATLLSRAGAPLLLGHPVVGKANVPSSRSGVSDGTPHLFLHIFVAQGWSPSYLFDARPRAFTAANLWENYNPNQETPLWTDRRGRTSWVSPAMKALQADFIDKPCFSVVKGLHSSPDFDGHFENLRLLLSGSTTGGRYLGVPLNQSDSGRPAGATAAPLDYLSLGATIFGSDLSGGTNLPLSLTLAQALRAMSDESGSPSAAAQRARQVTQQGYRAAGQSSGLGGAGARLFTAASAQTGSFKAALGRLDVAGLAASPSKRCVDDVALALRAFASGLSRTALLGFPVYGLNVPGITVNIDCHDGAAAAAQPAVYAEIASQLAEVFALLRNTPFDADRSMSFLDVTTVLVSSEFGRTNRQPGKAVDKTGTDHNRFGGLALVGGKGIEPGLFVGATDLDQLVPKSDSSGAQDFAAPSPSHNRFDPLHLMAMGHVYDFGTGTTVPAARPEAYNQSDYLTVGSLVNSLYDVFGVPANNWRAMVGRGGSTGETYKVITELIRKT